MGIRLVDFCLWSRALGFFGVQGLWSFLRVFLRFLASVVLVPCEAELSLLRISVPAVSCPSMVPDFRGFLGLPPSVLVSSVMAAEATT